MSSDFEKFPRYSAHFSQMCDEPDFEDYLRYKIDQTNKKILASDNGDKVNKTTNFLIGRLSVYQDDLEELKRRKREAQYGR